MLDSPRIYVRATKVPFFLWALLPKVLIFMCPKMAHTSLMVLHALLKYCCTSFWNGVAYSSKMVLHILLNVRHIYTRPPSRDGRPAPPRQTLRHSDTQVPPSITLNDLLDVKKDVFCQKNKRIVQSRIIWGLPGCLFSWPPCCPPGDRVYSNIHLITKTKSKCRRREISFSMCQISMPQAPHPGR